MKLKKATQGETRNFCVGFLHRTVADFLLEEHLDDLKTRSGSDFQTLMKDFSCAR